MVLDMTQGDRYPDRFTPNTGVLGAQLLVLILAEAAEALRLILTIKAYIEVALWNTSA